jgi:hypothetical protein
MTLFMMFVSADLSIKFPDDIEEQYRSEELESRDLQEKYHPERKNNTQKCRTSDSPEDRFFPKFWREVFGRHTDEDSVIPAHHEIDEDDVHERKCPCRSKQMEKICFESREKFEHKRFL